jgi:hypothetical protein
MIEWNARFVLQSRVLVPTRNPWSLKKSLRLWRKKNLRQDNPSIFIHLKFM